MDEITGTKAARGEGDEEREEVEVVLIVGVGVLEEVAETEIVEEGVVEGDADGSTLGPAVRPHTGVMEIPRKALFAPAVVMSVHVAEFTLYLYRPLFEREEVASVV